jgi:hypothetical protein
LGVVGIMQVIVQDTTVQCLAVDANAPPIRASSNSSFLQTHLHEALFAFQCLRVRTEMVLEVSSSNELGAGFEAGLMAVLGITDPSLLTFTYDAGADRRRSLQSTTRLTTVHMAINILQRNDTEAAVLVAARKQAQSWAQAYMAGIFLAGLDGLPEAVQMLTMRVPPVVIYSENMHVPMRALVAFLNNTLDPKVTTADPATLPKRTAATVAFLKLAPELIHDEFVDEFLSARNEIFAYTRHLIDHVTAIDPTFDKSPDFEVYVGLNSPLPDTYGTDVVKP